MGCDIHATLEYDRYYKRSTKPDKKHSWWDFAKTIDIDRGYYFFGIVAGVRNTDINSICEPRGVPKDASFAFKSEYDAWGADAHTPSYVTFEELKNWKRTRGHFEFDPEKDMKEQDFYKVMEILGERYGDENVRLVFFFDN